MNYKASSSPEEVAAFRPAPFPIYEVDRHRITLRRVLCAVALACFALVGFAPVKAGVCVLSVPVRYTRVELEQRSPVVLDLDFLAADVSVAPASLGYLTGKGQFLYTADVPRGLLYARGEEGVVVIEVVAPRNVEVFVDDYLQNIRGRLTELNRKQNLLELARKSAPADSDMQDHLIAEMWNALTPGYSGPELDDISHDALAIRGGQLAWLTAEISRDARHRARLKRLYYQTQLARLDLLASELDLQLALSLRQHPRSSSPDIRCLRASAHVLGHRHHPHALHLAAVRDVLHRGTILAFGKRQRIDHGAGLVPMAGLESAVVTGRASAPVSMTVRWSDPNVARVLLMPGHCCGSSFLTEDSGGLAVHAHLVPAFPYTLQPVLTYPFCPLYQVVAFSHEIKVGHGLATRR
ncbi:hypothetical protein IIA79_04705 [bacterium]|nr:hypothetical protein [bacterium]